MGTIPSLTAEQNTPAIRLGLTESRRDPDQPSQALPLDQELFAQLKTLRNQLAQKENVPLYMVLSNASLEAMATYYPQTKEELEQIKGFGKYKLIRYGDRFLFFVNSHCQKNQLTSRVELMPKSKKDEKSQINAKSVETTALYFKQGLSVDEIAALRKISSRTVIAHLVQAYETGMDIAVDAFVPAEKQQQIADIFQKFGTTQLTTVMEKLSGYSYNDLRWVRAKLQKESAGGFLATTKA